MDYNMNKLSEYIDCVYILKQTYNSRDHLKNLYNTFFKKNSDEKYFLNIYTETTIHLQEEEEIGDLVKEIFILI